MGYCSYQGLCSEEPHIGVELIEPFRGQGYGQEVAGALVDEFFARTGRAALYWKLFRINRHSAYLAEKMGGKLIYEQSKITEALGDKKSLLKEEDLAKYREFDVLVYKIERQKEDVSV